MEKREECLKNSKALSTFNNKIMLSKMCLLCSNWRQEYSEHIFMKNILILNEKTTADFFYVGVLCIFRRFLKT